MGRERGGLGSGRLTCVCSDREDAGWWRSWLQQSYQAVKEKVKRPRGLGERLGAGGGGGGGGEGGGGGGGAGIGSSWSRAGWCPQHRVLMSDGAADVNYTGLVAWLFHTCFSFPVFCFSAFNSKNTLMCFVYGYFPLLF